MCKSGVFIDEGPGLFGANCFIERVRCASARGDRSLCTADKSGRPFHFAPDPLHRVHHKVLTCCFIDKLVDRSRSAAGVVFHRFCIARFSNWRLLTRPLASVFFRARSTLAWQIVSCCASIFCVCLWGERDAQDGKNTVDGFSDWPAGRGGACVGDHHLYL